MKITRTLKQSIIETLNLDKIIIIYGPRQVGKTTLSRDILQKYTDKKILEISADEKRFRDILSSQDSIKLKELIGDSNIIFIDEAQRVPDIGLNLKIMHDQIPNLKIIVTGSSSFDLANKTKEPLTGRNISFKLYPLALCELKNYFSKIDLESMLDNILVYGLYPDVFNQQNLEYKYRNLKELTQSYIYKDILNLESIKNINKVEDLLQLLAFQVGSEVSMSELATQLSMNKATVEKYISILEQAFIVFRLSGYSKNLRKEVTKMDKIYFYDNGIRNVLINNFNNLKLRDDVGKVWENFLISERKKYIDYNNLRANGYFWRTYTNVEIDYVEEKEQKLYAYEFKYNTHNKKYKVPSTWIDAYPDSEFKVVSKDNFFEFIL